MSDNRPVAVFDSGVGGLSVLRELQRQMPRESFIYLGDRKNAPYGERTRDEVRAIAVENAALLFGMGAKALVIACNTATAAAVDHLRELYPDVPVIGIEPAVKPAVSAGMRRILVLATPVTVAEPRFAALIAANHGDATVIAVPCDGLAGLIEHGECQGEAAERYFNRIFAPYRAGGFDAVVLGCTHYPFVSDCILRAAGGGVTIFDGAFGTARQTQRRLAEAGIEAGGECHGSLTIISSDGSDYIADFYARRCAGQ